MRKIDEQRVRRMLASMTSADPEASGSAPGAVPHNTRRIVGALTLQHVGDTVVDAKTVLPWLLSAVGAPAALTGLLVPVRESGSMLPQAALVGWVRRVRARKWIWVAGAAVQVLAVVAMSLLTLTASRTTAGIALLACLTIFALGRSLSSLATKDVMGRTIPGGRRGRVTGLATLAGGAVAVSTGVAIRVIGTDEPDTGLLALLLLLAAGTWVVAAAVFAQVIEPVDDHVERLEIGWIVHAVGLLRTDPPFRRFITARTLLLVSALSPPFVVTLATARGGAGLEGLGPFVIATGLAALLGGRFWGGLADRSSRRTMMTAAGASSAIVLALLAALSVPAVAEAAWIYPLAYLLLALAHPGSRIGRKTYVIDMAEGNRRTDYVAVSNTAMGVVLLAAGAVSSGIAIFGAELALAFLAALGVLGVLTARSLPEVTAT
jgi:hypothetical protein